MIIVVLGKVNAAQLVVNTFPNLFNDAWLHGLLGQIGQVDESQSGLEAAVREQLDYRQLLVCVEGYSRWRVLSSRNPKLLRCDILFRMGLQLTDGMIIEKEKTFEHKSTRLGVLT